MPEEAQEPARRTIPQPIEQELKKSAYIGLPIVLGDRHKFLAALIVPNFERVREFAAQKKISFEPETIDANPEIRDLFQKEIDAYNADKPHHEQIRAFALLPSDLTIEDGSITPTLKVKRRILETRYQNLIDRMCQKCHDLDNSVKYKFERYWKDVEHPNPPAEGAVPPAAAK